MKDEQIRVRRPLTREQFIADIKASQARFERGEFRDDIEAHVERVRAYVTTKLSEKR